ncbi:MAG: hypothetical protein AAF389_04640 [Gemmatimonadota bacterium]
MLLRSDTLTAVKDGRTTLQFRRWSRPTVKAGGTLLTVIGQLAIESVDVVEEAEISDADARSSGFDDKAALMAMLDGSGKTAPIHRVRLRYAGPDPRIELRAALPEADELASIRGRLDRWDRASPVGAWTHRTLAVIARRPETLAAELAVDIGLERDRFKSNVRKLKGLGLTESLRRGYRISPRGQAVLDDLTRSGGNP